MLTISSVSALGISPSTKILVIMPHPDDESAFTAGFIYQASVLGATVHLLCITSGEASTLRHGLPPTTDLGQARERELQTAATFLGITQVEFGHIPDGGLPNHTAQATALISRKIFSFKPAILLTLEPDGIYGHPDHIALTALIQYLFPPQKIIMATVDNHFKPSKSAAAMAKRPIHPMLPTHRLFLSRPDQDIKIQALTNHHSQFINVPKFIIKLTARHLLQSEFFVCPLLK